MFLSVLTYYVFLKLFWFYSLVRAQVRFDALQDHWLFLGALYTAGVAFLSYAFIFSWNGSFPAPDWQVALARGLGVSPWQAWLAETLLLSVLYFRLMARFDEGAVFWTLLLLGLLVVWF